MELSQISALVVGSRIEAASVRSFELKPSRVLDCPITAGAHVDVRLPNGLVRQYSLINPGEVGRYVIAVNRDPQSRGGSKCLHEEIRLGDFLEVSLPRNNFELHAEQEPAVLIGGGIGITPIYAMAQTLNQQDRAWTVYYSARSRDRAAYLNGLQDLANKNPLAKLIIHIDEENPGCYLNLDDIVQAHGNSVHYYCCGPIPLMESFAKSTIQVDSKKIHREFFGAAPKTAEEMAVIDGDFNVHLARSGKTLNVPKNKSLLDVLLENNVRVLNSCREGVCGSCETRVLEGIPDHRDHVLSDEEKKSNCSMMVCVSRCRDGLVTIDL